MVASWKLRAVVEVRGPQTPPGQLAIGAPFGWLVFCMSARTWIRPEKLSPKENGFSSSFPIVLGSRNPRARNLYPNSFNVGIVRWHLEQAMSYFRANAGIEW